MRKLMLLAVLLAACSVKAEIVGPDTPVIINPDSCHPIVVRMADTLPRCERIYVERPVYYAPRYYCPRIVRWYRPYFWR